MTDRPREHVLDAELAELLRKQFEIDYEAAGPKAPYSHLTYKGIRLESRWDVLSEFETMKKAIDFLPELISRRIASIWCDSKCGSNFAIGVRSSLFAPELKRAIADAFLKANGGHNGIEIQNVDSAFSGETLAHIGCRWDE